MAGEIIRLGDSTTHGGIVLEGSPVDICMGKPIAFVGHKVQCPKCKGTFPIVEGAPVTTFYGKGVALAGMHTACGAVLIPSQFTDTVEYGGGQAPADSASTTEDSRVADLGKSRSVDGLPNLAGNGHKQFDDKFILLDAATGKPIVCTEYAIRRETGDIEHGISDEKGQTHLLSATASAEVIEIYI